MAKIIDLKIPDIGSSDVGVAEVYVKVGDSIKKDDGLLMLETDKATMDVPAEADGVIKEILIKVGDKVNEGDIVFKLEIPDESSSSNDSSEVKQSNSDDDDTSQANDDDSAKSDKDTSNKSKDTAEVSINDKSPTNKDEASAEEKTNNEKQKSMPSTGDASFKDSSTLTDEKVKDVEVAITKDNPEVESEDEFSKAFASPSIRKLARELGADLGRISGSGDKGRITEDDLKGYINGIVSRSGSSNNNSKLANLDLLPWPEVDFAKFGTIEAQELSRIKKLSGANLVRNWVMIPHVTQFDEADISSLEEFRKSLNLEYKDKAIKLTPLVFLIKACIYALKKYPEFNSSLSGDKLIYKKYFNIGFAADTPQGLVVPVIKAADKKGILELAKETAELAKLAREGKLKPIDMQGGTFTISSLGGIGGTAFTPIINAPEVAILGVSKASIKPYWDGVSFTPKLILPLSLSYDHRVIDGALAAKFTTYLAMLLSDIRRLSL